MTRLRLAQAALLLGAALLVAGFFIPWLTFNTRSEVDGSPGPLLAWSPLTTFWGAAGGPGLSPFPALRSPLLVTCGVLYLCGAVAILALAVPALRGPRRDGALSPIPWTLLGGAVTCGVVALLIWSPAPQWFGLSEAFGVGPLNGAAGLPLALTGALLASAGVIALHTGGAPRETPRAGLAGGEASETTAGR